MSVATKTARRRPSVVLKLVAWGTLWGAAMGLWLVAPVFLEAHWLYPETFAQWLTVQSVLVLLFGGGGAALAFYSAWIVILWQSARSRKVIDQDWSCALATPAVLVVVYMTIALVVERLNFQGLKGFERYRASSLTFIVIFLILCGALVAVYRYLVSKPSRPSPGKFAWALGLFVLMGGLALPWTAGPRPNPASSDDVQPTVTRVGRARPLLFVGVDSATWQTIEPLIDLGRLPQFKRLIDEGMQGTVEALWPPYLSAPAWASILTGHPRDELGIYEDLAVQASRLPTFWVPFQANPVLDPLFALEYGLVKSRRLRVTHPSRPMLAKPPFWEILAASGLEVGVIRFRFTFPADSAPGYVVSDYAGFDQWELIGVSKDDSAKQYSTGARSLNLDRHFPADPALERRPPRGLLPEGDWPKPPDVAWDPIWVLSIAADIDTRTLAASDALLRSAPRLDMLAVYLGGLDTVSHAYWQYRFPNQFSERPAAEDVRVLGPVLDRYLEFLDQGIGILLERFDETPNVIIVSDHGHAATESHEIWRGWHSSPGIFIAAGPDVPRLRNQAVTYYDVVPTIMALEGISVQPRFAGRSVVGRLEPRSAQMAPHSNEVLPAGQ